MLHNALIQHCHTYFYLNDSLFLPFLDMHILNDNLISILNTIYFSAIFTWSFLYFFLCSFSLTTIYTPLKWCKVQFSVVSRVLFEHRLQITWFVWYNAFLLYFGPFLHVLGHSTIIATTDLSSHLRASNYQSSDVIYIFLLSCFWHLYSNSFAIKKSEYEPHILAYSILFLPITFCFLILNYLFFSINPDWTYFFITIFWRFSSEPSFFVLVISLPSTKNCSTQPFQLTDSLSRTIYLLFLWKHL